MPDLPKVLFDEVVSDEDFAQADQYLVIALRTHDVQSHIGVFAHHVKTHQDLFEMGRIYGESLVDVMGEVHARIVLGVFLGGVQQALNGDSGLIPVDDLRGDSTDDQ